MKGYKVFDYVLPVWSICPLVNADTSSTTDEDDKKLDKFQECLNVNMETLEAKSWTIDWPDSVDSAKYFSTYNEVDGYLGADVVGVKIYFFY